MANASAQVTPRISLSHDFNAKVPHSATPPSNRSKNIPHRILILRFGAGRARSDVFDGPAYRGVRVFCTQRNLNFTPFLRYHPRSSRLCPTYSFLPISTQSFSSIGQNRWIQQKWYNPYMNYPTIIGQNSARTGGHNNFLKEITAFP